MNIKEAMSAAVATLKDAAISEPHREAASLLSFVLGRDATFMRAHPEYALSEAELNAFRHAVKRRSQHEPFQYITGRQEFWRLEFIVTRDVLIPRPETEILVEAAIGTLDALPSPRFCEVGSGSGCIAVSILHSVNGARAVATDVSAAALSVAEVNAQRHGVNKRLDLRHADLFENVTGQFDLIVSNPPYVPHGDIASLQPEVRDHEPSLALSGGKSGLDVISRIVAECPRLLKPGAPLLMEIGFDQAGKVTELFGGGQWQGVEFIPDLQGIPRIVNARIR